MRALGAFNLQLGLHLNLTSATFLDASIYCCHVRKEYPAIGHAFEGCGGGIGRLSVQLETSVRERLMRAEPMAMRTLKFTLRYAHLRSKTFLASNQRPHRHKVNRFECYTVRNLLKHDDYEEARGESNSTPPRPPSNHALEPHGSQARICWLLTWHRTTARPHRIS